MIFSMRAGLFIWIICFAPLLAHAQQAPVRNGNWWNGLNHVEKVSYVTGVFDGISGMADAIETRATPVPSNFIDGVFKQVGKTTSAQLSDGLDVFYSDYRNRNILADKAIWPTLGAINGSSKEDVELFTRSLRKAAALNKN